MNPGRQHAELLLRDARRRRHSAPVPRRPSRTDGRGGARLGRQVPRRRSRPAVARRVPPRIPTKSTTARSPAGPWRNRLVLGDQAQRAADARERARRAGLPRLRRSAVRDRRGLRLPGVDPRLAGRRAPRRRARLSRLARARRLARLVRRRRARLVDDLLAAGGSLYVHLDAHVAHYAKVVLDEVFGPGAFQREIVWRIGWVSGFKSRARGWIRNHDTLLFYAKGGPAGDVPQGVHPVPARATCVATASRRAGAGIPSRTCGTAATSTAWTASRSCRSPARRSGIRRRRTSRSSRASCGPRRARATSCSTSAWDPGTTAVVAEKLGRRWVACDASPIAVHATRKRLLRLPQVRPLVVQHVERVRRRQRAGEEARPPHRPPGRAAAQARRPRGGRRTQRDHRARVVRSPAARGAAVGARRRGALVAMDRRVVHRLGPPRRGAGHGLARVAIARAGGPAALGDARVRRTGPLRGAREGVRRAGRRGDEAARSRSRMTRLALALRLAPGARSRRRLRRRAAARSHPSRDVGHAGSLRAASGAAAPPKRHRPRRARARTRVTASRRSRPRCSPGTGRSRCRRRSRAASSRSWTCARPGSARSAPDGKSLYFSWSITGIGQIWRVDGPTHFPQQVTGGEDSTSLAAITPDGRTSSSSATARARRTRGSTCSRPRAARSRSIQHTPRRADALRGRLERLAVRVLHGQRPKARRVRRLPLGHRRRRSDRSSSTAAPRRRRCRATGCGTSPISRTTAASCFARRPGR